MKLSELLRAAANEALWNGYRAVFRGDETGIAEYSCNAVMEQEYRCALGDLRGLGAGYFLSTLGVSIGSLSEFDEFAYGIERQAVRYAWLMFAADIAEEEGR